MTLPVVHMHDPVANPTTGSDLAPADVAELEAEIRALAKEKDAVILAHNYQLPEVQRVADQVFIPSAWRSPSSVWPSRAGTPFLCLRRHLIFLPPSFIIRSS